MGRPRSQCAKFRDGGVNMKVDSMLISNQMNAAINEQIGNEFAASLQYIAIAAHFAGEGLAELANHFFKQSAEERQHAMKFVTYLLEAGGRVELSSIPAPQAAFKNAEEAVLLSLEQEKKVTDQINNLANLAIEQGDHITRTFLSWFVTEQLEEVSSMDNLLKV